MSTDDGQSDSRSGPAAGSTEVRPRVETGVHLDIATRGSAVGRVPVGGRVLVGREGVDVVVDDGEVSRRHLAIEPDPHGHGVIVTDLGSSNGSRLNGVILRGPTAARHGDRIELGNTTLTVVAPVDPLAGAPGREKETGGVRVEARPNTPADRARPGVEAAAAKAWKRLADLLPDKVRPNPVIRLVDPFPDPADPGRTVASGSIIDDQTGEIWTVATSEVPPDNPGRTLGLLVAALAGGGDDLAMLFEGYGLHLSGADVTDDAVRAAGAAPPSRAAGDARTLGAVSFVRFLLAREPEDRFREILREAPAKGLDNVLTEVFGRGLAALEQAWQNRLSATAGGDVKTGQFVRLAIRYLEPYKWRQFEIFLYMLFGMTFSIVLPFVSRRLFDSALPSREFSRVVTLLLVLGGAFALSLLAGLRQAWCSALVSGCVVRDLRESMFARLQRLPMSWFGRYQQGDVLSRMFNDVRSVESGLSQVIGTGISQVLGLVVSTVIMMTVQPLLGVVVLAAVPLVAFIYKRMSAGALARSLILQEESSSLLSVAAENHAAQPLVKLYGLHQREGGRFARAGARVMRAERRVTLFGGLFGLSVNSVLTVLRLGIMGLGSWLIIHDRLTVGGLVAFLGVMGEVISPATSLTQLGQSIQRSGGSLVRINEILHADTEDDDPAKPALAPLDSAIALEDVSFAYQPGLDPAVQGITCTIHAGTRAAFVGPSGSGKSTILRLLMRLDEPSGGRITFDGVDLRERSLASLRSQLGVVLQDPFLFDTSIKENLALGSGQPTDEELREAAREAEIDEFVQSLPRGYDTTVGDRGAKLSGGQRQRVSIARALVRRPRILLLDEATSALDPATERQINNTLQRIGGGRTTVAITHRLTAITGYDRIFVIDRGRLVEEGNHRELLALGGTYAHLWQEQTGEPLTAPDRSPQFDAVAAIRAVPPFAGLPLEAFDAIAGQLVPSTLREGDEVGESQGDVWLVVAGRAAVMVPTPSGPQPIGELESGDVFGLASLLGDSQGRRLRALGPLRLLQLRGGTIDLLSAKYPSFLQRLGARGAGGADGPKRGTRVTSVVSLRAVQASLAASRAASPDSGNAGDSGDSGSGGRP